MGGTHNLATRICALIDADDHATYAEPFVGKGTPRDDLLISNYPLPSGGRQAGRRAWAARKRRFHSRVHAPLNRPLNGQ